MSVKRGAVSTASNVKRYEKELTNKIKAKKKGKLNATKIFHNFNGTTFESNAISE